MSSPPGAVALHDIAADSTINMAEATTARDDKNVQDPGQGATKLPSVTMSWCVSSDEEVEEKYLDVVPDYLGRLPEIGTGLVPVHERRTAVRENHYTAHIALYARQQEEARARKARQQHCTKAAANKPSKSALKRFALLIQPPRPERFKFQMHRGGPPLLRKVLCDKGWACQNCKARPKGLEGKVPFDPSWNFRFQNWDCTSWVAREVRPWQRINRFPGEFQAIFRKDHLARALLRSIKLYGKMFAFMPPTFILPQDKLLLHQFCRIRHTSVVGEEEDESVMCNLEQYWRLLMPLQAGAEDWWILKPANLCRGAGIQVVQGIRCALEYDSDLIQVYVRRPLLVCGHKFDLRIYVAVASYQPLRVYIYEEGLVRWATDPFNLHQPQNRFSHLTNTSINDFSPRYDDKKPLIGRGCRWKLSRLREFFLAVGVDDRMLFQHISRIVICTLMLQVDYVPPAPYSIELLGFDILIDERFMPWLLEVNRNPSLASACRTDYVIKKPMLGDFVSMLRLKPDDKYCGKNTTKTPLWAAKPSRGTLPVVKKTAAVEAGAQQRTTSQDPRRKASTAAATRVAKPQPKHARLPPGPVRLPPITPATVQHASARPTQNLHQAEPCVSTTFGPKGEKCYHRISVDQHHQPTSCRVPRIAYGGFRLIFPFNTTTLLLTSMEDANKRIALRELQDALRELAFSCARDQKPGTGPESSAVPGSRFPANPAGYPFAMHQTLDPGVLLQCRWCGGRARDKAFVFRTPKIF